MAKRAAKAKAKKTSGAPAPATGKGPDTTPAAASSTTPAARPSPFMMMRRFGEEMDRLMDEFRARTASLLPHWERPGGKVGDWLPALEMSERGGKLVIRADLPGMTKDDVKVEVRDDVLCLQGERRQEKREKGKGFHRTEVSYGSFYREVPLPEGTDPEQATASFKNGVLEVTVPAPPKAAAAKARKVQVEG